MSSDEVQAFIDHTEYSVIGQVRFYSSSPCFLLSIIYISLFHVMVFAFFLYAPVQKLCDRF